MLITYKLLPSPLVKVHGFYRGRENVFKIYLDHFPCTFPLSYSHFISML